MTRQWRIGYEGALYHVLSRGNEGRDIAASDKDREVFVELLCRMCNRFDIELYCYVLMSNHFHLLVKTPRGNLSKSMQWLYAAIDETGWYTNAEIGLGLGLSGSAVSRRAAVLREVLKTDKVLNKKLNTIKSLIKV